MNFEPIEEHDLLRKSVRQFFERELPERVSARWTAPAHSALAMEGLRRGWAGWGCQYRPSSAAARPTS